MARRAAAPQAIHRGPARRARAKGARRASDSRILTTDSITVVAAVIVDHGRFLVTRRQKGVHLEGYWEFPGGKIDPDETHPAALRREIREELDADVDVGELLLTTTHAYPEKTVTLFFYRCRIVGTPQPLVGQEMRWVPRTELDGLNFPDADEELIKALVAADILGADR